MHVVDLNEDHSSAASMRRNARHHAAASPTHSVLTASEFGDPDRRGRSARIGRRARDDATAATAVFRFPKDHAN